jgi:hypothetical protein
MSHLQYSTAQYTGNLVRTTIEAARVRETFMSLQAELVSLGRSVDMIPHIKLFEVSFARPTTSWNKLLACPDPSEDLSFETTWGWLWFVDPKLFGEHEEIGSDASANHSTPSPEEGKRKVNDNATERRRRRADL